MANVTLLSRPMPAERVGKAWRFFHLHRPPIEAGFHYRAAIHTANPYDVARGCMPFTAAARQRHEHSGNIRDPLDDIEAYRPLSGNNLWMIEWWQHDEPVFFHQVLSRLPRLVLRTTNNAHVGAQSPDYRELVVWHQPRHALSHGNRPPGLHKKAPGHDCQSRPRQPTGPTRLR